MATSRIDLKQKLFSDLRNDSTLMGLLGPVASTNYRIYAGHPQHQPALTGHEPAEGWVTFHAVAITSPWGTPLYEDHTYQFNVYATRQTIGDQVVARLDALWQTGGVDQHGYLITEDWVVTSAQQILEQDLYEEIVHLYRKLVNWTFRVQKVPYRVGA